VGPSLRHQRRNLNGLDGL